MEADFNRKKTSTYCTMLGKKVADPAVTIVDDGTVPLLPDTPVPADLRFGYGGDPPLFIGHYWMRGEPTLLTPRVACVDYSAGKNGPLVAYRWEQDGPLEAACFVSSADT